MTQETKAALILFSGAVTSAIRRLNNEGVADPHNVIEAEETLVTALMKEPITEDKPT